MHPQDHHFGELQAKEAQWSNEKEAQWSKRDHGISTNYTHCFMRQSPTTRLLYPQQNAHSPKRIVKRVEYRQLHTPHPTSQLHRAGAILISLKTLALLALDSAHKTKSTRLLPRKARSSGPEPEGRPSRQPRQETCYTTLTHRCQSRLEDQNLVKEAHDLTWT